MGTFITVYFWIGMVMFVLAQLATHFGNQFSAEKFKWSDFFIHLIWLGVLWPVGVAAIVYALGRSDPKQPD